MIFDLIQHSEEIFLSVLENLKLAWWVEIKTEEPDCIYYFGPFINPREAKYHQKEYIQDLQEEGSKIAVLEIKQCQPKQLTIYNQDEKESYLLEKNPVSYSFSL